jgi:hypothetical protein
VCLSLAFTTFFISRKITPVSHDSYFLTDVVQDFICVGYLELLFFRSELKMVAPDVEFMTKECRTVMHLLFLKVKTSKQICDNMSVMFCIA